MVKVTGTDKQESTVVVPIGPGEAHLQNEITSYKCLFCKRPSSDDMALLRIGEKKMGLACLRHPGVAIEFMRQYNRPPLGWVKS